jgi:hypothetical protein
MSSPRVAPRFGALVTQFDTVAGAENYPGHCNALARAVESRQPLVDFLDQQGIDVLVKSELKRTPESKQVTYEEQTRRASSEGQVIFTVDLVDRQTKQSVLKEPPRSVVQLLFTHLTRYQGFFMNQNDYNAGPLPQQDKRNGHQVTFVSTDYAVRQVVSELVSEKPLTLPHTVSLTELPYELETQAFQVIQLKQGQSPDKSAKVPYLANPAAFPVQTQKELDATKVSQLPGYVNISVKRETDHWRVSLNNRKLPLEQVLQLNNKVGNAVIPASLGEAVTTEGLLQHLIAADQNNKQTPWSTQPIKAFSTLGVGSWKVYTLEGLDTLVDILKQWDGLVGNQ